MAGRRPKPAAVKKASGNPGKRRIVDTPPDAAQLEHVAPSQFPAPDWLKSKRARTIFGELAPTLRGLNFIKATDRNAFSRYCEYLSLWLDLASKVTAATIVQRTTSEHVEMDRLDKRFQAMLLLEKRLQDLEDRFGLNPTARQTLLQKTASMGRGGLFPDAQPDGDDKKMPAAPPPDAVGSAIGLLRSSGKALN